jgi:hypothetical protein
VGKKWPYILLAIIYLAVGIWCYIHYGNPLVDEFAVNKIKLTDSERKSDSLQLVIDDLSTQEVKSNTKYYEKRIIETKYLVFAPDTALQRIGTDHRASARRTLARKRNSDLQQ